MLTMQFVPVRQKDGLEAYVPNVAIRSGAMSLE
jgi:hypothetical protein